MIRTRWIVDTSVLDSLSNYAARFDQRAFEIGERVFDSLADDVLEELRFYPPPPPNSDYERTYRLRNGWQMNIVPATGGFTIEILNTATDKRGRPYSKYVKGSLVKARAAAAKAQAWMHKGRWPLAFDTVQAFYDLFFEAYGEEFQRDLAAYGTTSVNRRAFTR
jgi:hypothetical protein